MSSISSTFSQRLIVRGHWKPTEHRCRHRPWWNLVQWLPHFLVQLAPLPSHLLLHLLLSVLDHRHLNRHLRLTSPIEASSGWSLGRESVG